MPTYTIDITWPQTDGVVAQQFTAEGVVTEDNKKSIRGAFEVRLNLSDGTHTYDNSGTFQNTNQWRLLIPRDMQQAEIGTGYTLTARLYVSSAHVYTDSEIDLRVAADGPRENLVQIEL